LTIAVFGLKSAFPDTFLSVFLGTGGFAPPPVWVDEVLLSFFSFVASDLLSFFSFVVSNLILRVSNVSCFSFSFFSPFFVEPSGVLGLARGSIFVLGLSLSIFGFFSSFFSVFFSSFFSFFFSSFFSVFFSSFF